MVFKQEPGGLKQEMCNNIPKQESGPPEYMESKQQDEYEQYFRKLDSKSTMISDLDGPGPSFRVENGVQEAFGSMDQRLIHPVSPGGVQRVSSTTRCEGEKNTDIGRKYCLVL